MITAPDPALVHFAPRKGIAVGDRRRYPSEPMMDGYSVQDAAAVLGVPEGRVWELLARGVLSGTPEGDSMRVFLKADAPAPARPATRQELPAGNGNGGSHGGEASAFRELLTEFRNLTERYGQALLALGEARGEVAGLRSRVEQLEARIDLRLPSRVEEEPISWAAPAPRARVPEAPSPEPPSPAEVEAVLPAPAPVERASRSKKQRTTRAAVAGFAEALARAQDPNITPVTSVPASPAAPVERAPEAEAEAAEAPHEAEPIISAEAEPTEGEIAAGPILSAEVEPAEVHTTAESIMRADAEVEAPEAEIAAELIASAEAEPAPPIVAEAPYRPAEIEPDWFADGDFSWLDAADLEARSQPETVAAEVETTGVVEPVAEPVVEAAPQAEPAPATMAEPESAKGAVAEAEPAPIVAEITAEPEPEPAREPAFEPEPAPRAAPLGQMEPVEMSDVAEEPLTWRGHAEDEAGEMETGAARSYPGPTLAPRIRDALEPLSWPATDRGTATTQAVAPPLAMTEAELAQLARDEGWDEAEVAAIRAMISKPAAVVELPGSAELDEAMSALQAVPIAPRAEPAPSSQWAKPPARGEETRVRDDWAFEVEPEPAPFRASAPQPQAAPRRAAPDPDWLRRRRGPAASAYRRIRRIFSG